MDSLGLTASLLVIFTLSSDHLEVYRLINPFTFRTVQRSTPFYDVAVGSFWPERGWRRSRRCTAVRKPKDAQILWSKKPVWCNCWVKATFGRSWRCTGYSRFFGRTSRNFSCIWYVLVSVICANFMSVHLHVRLECLILNIHVHCLHYIVTSIALQCPCHDLIISAQTLNSEISNWDQTGAQRGPSGQSGWLRFCQLWSSFIASCLLIRKAWWNSWESFGRKAICVT